MNPKLDRAKLYANSFDPLKGFAQELRRRERLTVQVEKKELSEDKKAFLDRVYSEAQLGDQLTVIYFDKGEYVKVTGVLSQKNSQDRYIKIVNTKIFLDDVYDMYPE